MSRAGGFHGPNRGGAGEKAKDFKGSMKNLIVYMSRYKFRLCLVLLCAIAGTTFSIVGPKILGKATTELFNGLVAKVQGTGGIDFEKIGQILLSVMALYLVSAAFSLIQGFVMTGISNDVSYSLRKEISQKINRMPMKYFESRTYGEVLSRVTNDVDMLQQGISQSITQLITSVTTLIGVLIMMISINGWMTLAAFLILPVSMLIITTVMKRSQKFFRDQQSYLGDVNGQVEEIYSGQNVVKAFNKEEDVVNEFEKANKKLYESGWKAQFFSGMMMPIMSFIGNFSYVAVCIAGALLVMNDQISFGVIIAFIIYVRLFTNPLSQIAQGMTNLQTTAAAGERVFEFLEEPEMKDERRLKGQLDPEKVKGSIQFKHVQFGYDKNKLIKSYNQCEYV